MSLAKGAVGDSPRAAEQLKERLKERLKVARGDAPADFVIRGAKWLDVFTGCWAEGDVAVFDGVIVGVGDSYDAKTVIDGSGRYIVPGMIDAHVHIESSLMTPRQFASAVLPRGTTSVVWDPHEIANVWGVAGIRWALEASKDLDLSVFVMVPSCVPSTSVELGLETSGAVLSAGDLVEFKDHPRVLGLAEMMNWPGLVAGDSEVIAKLNVFGDKKRDGHCPGLSGKMLNAYGVAGIHSCHESTTASEASEKLRKGIHVLIREGSCAKDADALLPLLTPRTSATLAYCSDDRNPLDIEESGHLDCVANKALAAGHDPVDVFRASSWSVARMYGMDDRGAIAPGYRADLVVLAPRSGNGDFRRGVTVEKVAAHGKWVAIESGHERTDLMSAPKAAKANINAVSPGGSTAFAAADFTIKSRRASTTKINVIGIRPGQIITDKLTAECAVDQGLVRIDAKAGLNTIAVIERHHRSGNLGLGAVRGLGLTRGAIATSINHDCHNIIVAGSSPALIAAAVTKLQEIDGGIVVVSDDGRHTSLPLPIGGLMTEAPPPEIAARLRDLKAHAKAIGCVLEEPFLQLSFLALPVIPSIKITDRGLVDGESFRLMDIEI